MEEKLNRIKKWLGAGSINIFGLPMSGKDTVGKRLALDLDAKFLSSGDIIRAVEAENGHSDTANGKLIPTDNFYDLVLPYFSHKDLSGSALVLSSIGRWSGEETKVMASAEKGGHPIKLAIFLDISEDEARARWTTSHELGDRGVRADDLDPTVFQVRLDEFREKTLPVLETYRAKELLITIPAIGPRDDVYRRTLESILTYADS